MTFTKELRALNARACKENFDQGQKRNGLVNVCTAQANWNACDFIDFGLQADGVLGQECWEQTKKHWCCHVVEVVNS